MSLSPSSRRADWVLNAVVIMIALLVLAAIIIPSTSRSPIPATRSIDSSHLRQIGQASLIYASDNQNQLPQTDSVTEFAAALARGGGLNDANIWIATEEASLSANRNLSTVLNADRTAPTPEFLHARLAFTVVARGLHANLPVTTPVAWTRGLRPDGTWSKDSPYKGDGGHIVFLGGNVQFYRNLASAPLTRFDNPEATTTDIRQALPPEAVIAEPTDQQLAAVARPSTFLARHKTTRPHLPRNAHRAISLVVNPHLFLFLRHRAACPPPRPPPPPRRSRWSPRPSTPSPSNNSHGPATPFSPSGPANTSFAPSAA
jgi:hypothetical protein